MSDSAPDSVVRADDTPPPLLGCLYCHTEGAITLAEGRKILGLGSGLPTLTCRQCGSVAVLDAASGGENWRIRYRKVNRDAQHYYAMIYLGGVGWLRDQDALDISRRAYVQRQRVIQAEAGDLDFLRPEPLSPLPPLMSADEYVYVALKPVSLQQASRNNPAVASDEDPVADSGVFYLTDRKLHLIGQRRDWSHRLSEVREVTYSDRGWRVYVTTSNHYYQGGNLPDQLDAQLFAAVVRALMR